MSTSETGVPPAAGPSAAPAAPEVRGPVRHRRPAARGVDPGAPARLRWMASRISEGAWVRLDGRAERAGLALGAWAGLLAEEVALGRPGLHEDQVEAVAAARVRVDRVGSLVNQLAVAEHRGRGVSAAELGAVLDRVELRVGEVRSGLGAVGAVFATAVPAAGAGAAGAAGDAVGAAVAAPGAGRRAAALDGTDRRQRRVLARMTAAEYDRVAAAAARDGLSVGAWLGRLLEDPHAARPLPGEAWGAVFLLRKALRRVATNLAQIEAVRAARGEGGDEGLARVGGQVDAAIRACLDVCGAIGAASKTGVAP